jgi:protoheme IX farnesyltransferase
MMPVVASFARTARQMIVYTVILWALTVVFAQVAGMGALYWAAAIVLGAVFVAFAVRLQREGTPDRAMRVFSWSITYVMLLFGAMAVDTLVRFH